MSWLLRGIQSAIFYYASCTPYYNHRHMRKRRAESRADTLAREKYEKDIPDHMIYRQPKPQATNPFWVDEIRMGPGPPPKYAKKSAKRLRELERVAEALTEKQLASAPGTPMVIAQDDSGTDEKSAGELEGWNHRFYQREDEELWGITQVPFTPKNASSTNTTPPKSRNRPHTASSAASSTIRAKREALIANTLVSPTVTPTISNSAPQAIYGTPSAPPLNAHHPPIVRNPRFSRCMCTRWVLQPCPAPSVMAGRRPVQRESKRRKLEHDGKVGWAEPGLGSKDSAIGPTIAAGFGDIADADKSSLSNEDGTRPRGLLVSGQVADRHMSAPA